MEKYVTKLEVACQNGDLDTVKCILKNNKIKLYETNALISAIGGGHLKIVKYLVKYGALVNTSEGDHYDMI